MLKNQNFNFFQQRYTQEFDQIIGIPSVIADCSKILIKTVEFAAEKHQTQAKIELPSIA